MTRIQPNDPSSPAALEPLDLFTAPWVIPIKGPPLEGGGLLVSGGRVRSVGRAADLVRSWPAARRVDLDGCALMPALVNAHTHLELTELCPPRAADFVGWILEVVAQKSRTGPENYRAGIRSGAHSCLKGGQGVVADVSSAWAGCRDYPRDGPTVLVFPEVIAPQEGQAAEALRRALDVKTTGGGLLAGLSPHAPYTVCAAAYRVCLREAARRSVRVMTHVAESRAELEFCLRERGEILDRLYGRLPIKPPPSPWQHPFAWLDRIGMLGSRSILVHMTFLESKHIDVIARRGASAVLCPRSNRRLSGSRAPGRALLDAGVPLALGTDSHLSAGSLDLWQDLICAVEDYQWSPEEALRAATLGGSRVLGIDADRGAFAPGYRADILALPLGSGKDLWDRILGDPAPAAVWLAGVLRFSRACEPGPRIGGSAG